jgi:hypothetical protein
MSEKMREALAATNPFPSGHALFEVQLSCPFRSPIFSMQSQIENCVIFSTKGRLLRNCINQIERFEP